MLYLTNSHALLFSATLGDTEQFECDQYHGHGHNSFSPDNFCCVVIPENEYYFKRNFLFSKLEEIEDKQQVKDHILNFLSIVPIINQPYKVFVEVEYKYDVGSKGFNDMIAHNNYNNSTHDEISLF